MIFAGIDVNIITHAKALAAGVEAFGLWCWGMCYAQLHETDGRLPRVAVMSAMGEQRRVLRRAAVRLVTSGLWIELEDGSFQALNYDKKNQTADEIRAKKAQAAERSRRWRERVRNAQSDAPVTRDERIRTDPPPPPPPDNTTTTRQQREGARAQGASRVLRPDEPLTEQRRQDFEAEIGTLPMRDIEPEWKNFVDDRIAKSVLFATAAAVDADWRKWVRRENVIQAKARIKAQNDTSPSSRRGPQSNRQPHDQAWLDRMLATGTDGKEF